MKNSILRFGKKVLKNELVNGASYVFIGSISASFFSFLANLFFARNLIKSDYGIFASLIALITLFIIPASSLTPIIVRFVSVFFAKKEEEKMKEFYGKITKSLIVLSVIILILFLIFSKTLTSFLNLNNPWYIPLVGLVVAMSYLNVVNTGFLQGLLKFFSYSLNHALGPIVRLLSGILLIFLGFRVFGAIWASFFSYIIMYLFGVFQLRSIISRTNKTRIKIRSGELIKYALPSTIAILCLSSFISTDVILVKHFFSPVEAGIYSGLSLIGKVVYYLTATIPIVMFPLITRRHAKKEPFERLFCLGLFLVLIPSVLISAFYFLFPEFTVRIFLGQEYVEVVPYLGFFGIFIGSFSMLNLTVNFFLSIKRTLVFIPIFIGSLLQIILISFFHSNFLQIIFISTGITSGLFIYLIGFFIITRKKDFLKT